MAIDTNTDEDQYTSASTRPQVASRRATRSRVPRRVTRYTLDLEAEQHRFLRLFALQNGIQASLVMRALLYLLETDVNIANRVIDEIYSVPEDEVGDDNQ